MKHILLIMPYGSVGGMERLALHFYNYYKSIGYKVTAVKFIALKTDIINFNEDEHAFLKKDLFELSLYKRLWFYISAPYKLRTLIKKEHITHSIAFGDMANIFSALTYTKEFKIGSIHALKSVELNSNSIFTKIIKWSYKNIYKNFNKVVCISTAIKKDLIEHCNYKFHTNLKVIYNPHDIGAIQNLAQEPIESEKEKALFNGQSILFIGRLSIQKAPWHLVNAFKHLSEKNKTVNLIFIGDGDFEVIKYVKRLIEQYNLENRVHFLGRKTNPYQYLKQADTLALSSYYEGTPNVIVEAIALGIPVVSSNCTEGIGELMSVNPVQENKNENIHVEAGIITPNLYKGALGLPENNNIIPKELKITEALGLILSNNYFQTNLIKNQKKLLEKFDVKITAQNYLK